MTRISFLLLWGLAIGALPSLLRAEIFVLQNDGQVRGEILNKDESPRRTYLIKTDVGGQITLTTNQVKQILHQTPLEMEYDRVRGRYPDTVAGQWEFAEWCREHQLPKQRATHLQRVIALDPNHVEAYHALGYSQIQGRWVTKDQAMESNGYVRYKGSWRLPQEVELIERDRKSELAQKEWFVKLKRWRGWLDTDKAEQGRVNIQAIQDPYAVKALADYLGNESQRDIQMLYLQSLAKIGSPNAMNVLAGVSLDNPDEEIRLACLEKLVGQNFRPAVAKFVDELKNKDNILVNRSAVGLSYMNDASAVGPLIDALVTTHKFKIVKGQPGQMSTTFGNGPGSSGGGFSFGGGGTEILTRKIPNPDVLTALVQLTGGVNFSFDTQAWKYWYAAQKKPATLDARRD